MELGVSGRVAVVTGASRGIGLEVARRLVQAGSLVLMTARDESRLAAAAEEIGARFLAIDVTSADCPTRLQAYCADSLGPIDILVNNAGLSFARSLSKLTDDDWRQLYEIHVIAPMRLMRELAPAMAERGWGRIVNVASSGGKRPSLTNAAYSVSKTGQLALSRLYADRWASSGVRVNSVAPGGTMSELYGAVVDEAAHRLGRSREAIIQEHEARMPIGRLLTPDEVADVIVFLCSELASGVTGAAWSVDGGSVPSFL
jgi:3-oxoacyl-[acyl-carrier protein] reductase